MASWPGTVRSVLTFSGTEPTVRFQSGESNPKRKMFCTQVLNKPLLGQCHKENVKIPIENSLLLYFGENLSE